ncbi:hypothetical protein [Aggregatilinea lenta]|uniref:hypothetical protein n=1 Tax=Aggregatilinea lenta TaxID=913108 RepID=UPI0013C2FE2F|nr:hypothetical protein [Aggregatilinea lenta]
MAISVSDYLGIDAEEFAQTGAFDAILDVDAKLFIDPHLLKDTSAPELQGSYGKVRHRFIEILKLLEASKKPGDKAWREAAHRFRFPEVQGLCIGYSAQSTSGSGMGEGIRHQLLTTAKLIVDSGIRDPEMFELMGLFEEGVGADRISDMLARIILEDLLTYSERIFSEFGVTRTREIKHGDKQFSLPSNPFNRWPIILVPMDILRDLPQIFELSDISDVIDTNWTLRQRLNQVIGISWRDARKLKKRDYKDILLHEPEILSHLIVEYRQLPTQKYSFDSDPAGQFLWYRTTRRYANQYPLDLKLVSFPKPEQVLTVVLAICNQFKQLIENNGLHTLLYRDDACLDPKREEAAQKVFLGIADAYCKANNLDLSPEINSGRGYVDFKISRGYSSRVIVETKLTTNQNLLHGYQKQIGEYQKAEQTNYAVYLVIDVEGGPKKRLEEFSAYIETSRAENEQTPEVLIVYGRRKPSASHFH